MNNRIFDSLTQPIPAVRRDVQLIPVQNDDREMLFFYDTMGYLTPNFALDIRVEPVLSLLSGRHSIQEITGQLNGSLSSHDLLQFIQLLDTHKVLESDHYQTSSEEIETAFENSVVRPAVFAGESYPADPGELKYYIRELLEKHQKPAADPANKALYAPHIDLRVGSEQYAEAFSSLRNLKPKRVVILATSHYSGYYKKFYENHPFIGSRKNFRIPGREFKTDQQVIKELSENPHDNGFTIQDRAHRVEHSIELHLLFISQLWEHDFELVPVLVSGFEELYYHDHGALSKKIDLFSSQLQLLDDEETFFLISGDLSHVGRKFGDTLSASEMRKYVVHSDQKFMKAAVSGNSQSLLKHVCADYDSTRICGFPPLYTFLKTFPSLKGTPVNYHWWDETERDSAVSFGSIKY